MKKIFFLAGLAVLAAAVSSCDENGNFISPKVDVPIESSSDVQAEDLLALKSADIKTDDKGCYFIEKSASAPLSATVDLKTTETKLPGSLEIDCSSIPEVAKPSSGKLSQSFLILEMENPADEKVSFKGSAAADSKVIDLPAVSVDPKSEKLVAFVSTGSSAVVPPVTVPEEFVAIPSDGDALDMGPSKITVKDLGVTSLGTKAAAPAGGSYSFKVDAMYVAPLYYSAGTKLHINRTFQDLKIVLDRINYPCAEYDIVMDVENTLPFDIMMSVSSAEGVSGSLKNAIKAGSLNNPVTTSVAFNVKDSSGKAVSNISTATLGIDLTAAEGATLQKGQKLGLNVSKVTIIKAL